MVGFDRWRMMDWLEREGFERVPSRTGHAQFKHPVSGVKIAVTAHGRGELSKNEECGILRTPERCGYDRAKVREEVRR